MAYTKCSFDIPLPITYLHPAIYLYNNGVVEHITHIYVKLFQTLCILGAGEKTTLPSSAEY